MEETTMTTVINPSNSVGSTHIVRPEPVNLNGCVTALLEPYIDIAKRVWYSPVGDCVLVKNGSFELWSNGTSVPPDHWVNDGLLSVRQSGITQVGTYSALLIGAATTNNLYFTTYNVGGYLGEVISFGCWVYSSDSNCAAITLDDGANSVTARHQVADTWEFITVSMRIADNANFIQLRLYPDERLGWSPAVFDGAMIAKGTEFLDFNKQFRTGSNNGTIYGNPQKVGRGLYFDGVDDYLECGDLGFANETFTVGAWWNQTSSVSTVAPPVSILKYDRPSTGASFAPCTNSILRICYGRSNGNYMNFTITQAYNFNEWYHTMVTYDGTTLKTYFNGKEKDSRNATIPKSVHSYIARWTTYSSHYFHGSVDDVKICNGAKSGDEVLAEYNLAKERYT